MGEAGLESRIKANSVKERFAVRGRRRGTQKAKAGKRKIRRYIKGSPHGEEESLIGGGGSGRGGAEENQQP